MRLSVGLEGERTRSCCSACAPINAERMRRCPVRIAPYRQFGASVSVACCQTGHFLRTVTKRSRRPSDATTRANGPIDWGIVGVAGVARRLTELERYQLNDQAHRLRGDEPAAEGFELVL